VPNGRCHRASHPGGGLHSSPCTTVLITGVFDCGRIKERNYFSQSYTTNCFKLSNSDGVAITWLAIYHDRRSTVDPFHQAISERTETMTPPKSLISVLNVCDNFRPHLSPEPLVPFLLTPKSRPPLGLLRPPVVAALRADNAWRSANGHPLAWDIPSTTANSAGSTYTNDAPSPPYIAFAPVLASGSPAARTHALAETLERWRANANKGDGDGAGTFAEVIGGSRWRSEWYDVYLAPGGALRTDGRDPLTLVEVPTSDSASGPVSVSSSGYGVYVFSMERSACALFGVVTHGVHMTVYEQKGDADGDIPMRVWVPRRAATKPTCVCHVSFPHNPLPRSPLLSVLHLLTCTLIRAYLSPLILSLFCFHYLSRVRV
jgi:hypothetical protein